MPSSSVMSDNWFYSIPPPEMDSAAAVINYSGGVVRSVISYIGSTVFQMTSSVTRRYDLDSQNKVGPYVRAIDRKLREGGASTTQVVFDIEAVKRAGSLSKWADDVVSGAIKYTPATGFPPIWGNAVWAQSTVLNPGEDMSKQMKSSDADDLLSMLNGATGTQTAKGPASDPPEPTPRVEEGNPVNSKIPPHRRSVIKGLRDTSTYVASLMR